MKKSKYDTGTYFDLLAKHGSHSQYSTGSGEFLPDLLDEDEVCEYLGKSRAWLQRDRWQGGGIKFVKIGQSIKYRADDLQDYLNAQTRTHT